MLIQRLRHSLEREEGQALVLACLMVLVLSIAVLTTVNIGHTVHERIRLQNNADATAYSMAAMEARAFNFYAFANRTQVSHYVSAMVWQSLDSFIFFLEAFLTDVFGVMVTLDKCAHPPDTFWKVACPLIEKLPYIGPVIAAVDKVIGFLGDIVQAVQKALSNNALDQFLGKTVSAHRVLNQVLDSASVVMMASALQHIADPASTALGKVDVIAAGVAAKNDPNLGTQKQQIPLAFLNACYFDRAHFREAGGSPFDPGSPFTDLDVTAKSENDKVARAKRSMAQIANATRFGCDTSNGIGPLSDLCPDGFVTDRRLGSLLPSLKLFGTDVLKGLSPFLDTFDVWGQTRLLTDGLPFGKDGYTTSPPGTEWWQKKGFCGGSFSYKKQMNRIREAPSSFNYMGTLAQGDDLGADDIYFISFPPENWLKDFPPSPFSNPFQCKENDDWRFCWGDNRVQKGGANNRYQMPMKTSVWALNHHESPSGGVHWRVQLPGIAGPHTRTDGYTRDYGLNKMNKCAGIEGCSSSSIEKLRCPIGVEVAVYAANVEPVVERWHQWDGIVRFPHFEPGQYAQACLQGLSNLRNGDPSLSAAAGFAMDQGPTSSAPGDFNQPSEWVLFHKSPEDMHNPAADDTGAANNNPAVLNDSGELTFHFTSEGQKVTLDDKAHDGNTRNLFGLPTGVTAISRGQTYYHRPGNWKEQPNFFNPYWRPRLASVWQGRKTLPLVGDLVKDLPGPLKAIPQKILTH